MPLSFLSSLFLAFYGTASVYAQSKTEYDYIICGGGTAGLAVANRLTESPNITVLVVEAGINGTTDRWDYISTPQQYSNGRVLDLPAGKTVGGSSQINGQSSYKMYRKTYAELTQLPGKVYSRPDASSIDDWGRVNDADWSWDTLLPFYKVSESLFVPSEDQEAAGDTYNVEYHGLTGPVNVSFPAEPIQDFFAVLEDTSMNMSIPRNVRVLTSQDVCRS